MFRNNTKKKKKKTKVNTKETILYGLTKFHLVQEYL